MASPPAIHMAYQAKLFVSLGVPVPVSGALISPPAPPPARVAVAAGAEVLVAAGGSAVAVRVAVRVRVGRSSSSSSGVFVAVTSGVALGVMGVGSGVLVDVAVVGGVPAETVPPAFQMAAWTAINAARAVMSNDQLSLREVMRVLSSIDGVTALRRAQF